MLKKLLFLTIAIVLSACGTLQVSLDRTPTPDFAGTGTVQALQNQNAQLGTAVARLGLSVQSLSVESSSDASQQKMLLTCITGGCQGTETACRNEQTDSILKKSNVNCTRPLQDAAFLQNERSSRTGW
jgi:starvation-inducible outer membrane lipoprotein